MCGAKWVKIDDALLALLALLQYVSNAKQRIHHVPTILHCANDTCALTEARPR
jgi:hypothetical protein